MPFYDSPAAQRARFSEDDPRLARRQADGGLDTLIFTTTVELEQAFTSSIPIVGASFSPIKIIEPITQVVTSTVLVSPTTAPADSPSPSSLSPPTALSSAPPAAVSSASSLIQPSTPALPTLSPSTTSGSSQTADVATAQNSVQPASTKSSSLPPGAIAAIVVVVVVVLNLAGICFYRRRQLARRQLRRATWKAGIRAKSSDFSALEKGAETQPPVPTPFMLGVPSSSNRTSVGAASVRSNQNRQSTFSLPSALARTFPRDSFSPSRAISPASRARGPPARPARSDLRSPPEPRPTRKAPPPTAAADRASQVLATPANAKVPTALVRVTFVPTRPDELSISIGQTLAVLHHFDDGWALCANAYGEQGMVPLECLEGGGGEFAGYKDRTAMMQSSSRRASSLYIAANTSTR